MKDSKIEWTRHTFNPWRGCTKVSPGCAHCYAETLARRNPKVLGVWGKGQPRVLASEEMWRQPRKWDRMTGDIECSCTTYAGMTWVAWAEHVFGGKANCIKCGGALVPRRQRVFCASLADWLDEEVPADWLARLLGLIAQTPNLDWLLLTKRPENWRPRIEAAQVGAADDLRALAYDWLYADTPPANVWIGTTVEDQSRADERIPHLLRIPATVRFLSCEPLLGPVHLPFIDFPKAWEIARAVPIEEHDPKCSFAQTSGGVLCDCRVLNGRTGMEGLHWVICGGESGPGARPMHPDWARSLRDQCAAAGVPFLFKQWGQWAPRPAGVSDDEEPWADVPYGEFHGSADWVESCLCEAGTGTLYRVGKKAAGRLLDGREHKEFPRVESEVAA